MTVRARYDGKNFVPIDPVDLPKDQIVELEIRAESQEPLRKGSPEALRQLMRQIPPLEPGDAAALEAAIEAGKQPIRYDHIFDESDRP